MAKSVNSMMKILWNQVGLQPHSPALSAAYEKDICNRACENWAYPNKLHTFRKWYVSWSLCVINNFCKFCICTSLEIFSKVLKVSLIKA